MTKPKRGISQDEGWQDQHGDSGQGRVPFPLSRLFGRLLAMGLSWLAASHMENFVLHLIRRKVKSLTPAEALRLLFRLDGQLYFLQG